MPIRFRCSRCHRLLGIGRRKAGTETRCPHCGSTIMVPRNDVGEPERIHLEDIEELLNPVLVPPAPAVATRPAPPPAAPRVLPRPAQEPSSADRPLFERDIDSVLGANGTGSAETELKGQQPANIGMDAMSLEPEPNQIVLSPQKATALAVIVVILLAVSFAAGVLVGSH